MIQLRMSVFKVLLLLQVTVPHHVAPVEHVNHMAVQPPYMRPVHHPLMIHTLNSHMSGKPTDLFHPQCTAVRLLFLKINSEVEILKNDNM